MGMALEVVVVVVVVMIQPPSWINYDSYRGRLKAMMVDW